MRFSRFPSSARAVVRPQAGRRRAARTTIRARRRRRARGRGPAAAGPGLRAGATRRRRGGRAGEPPAGAAGRDGAERQPRTARRRGGYRHAGPGRARAGGGWHAGGRGPGRPQPDRRARGRGRGGRRPPAPWPEEPAPPAGAGAAPRARPEPRPSGADDGRARRALDDLDDIAVTIGRVVSIRGSVVWGALFDDDDGTAARAARMGALVSMRGPDSRVFGIVNALQRDGDGGGPQAERTIFEIQVLGEISTVSPGAKAAGFQRGVSSYPPLDAPVTTVTLRDLAAVYARPRVSNVHVGRLRHNHKVPAFVLTDSLLGKHFAVLGTTGAGKSCAVTVILRSILDELPNGHVVLLDPHNEYASALHRPRRAAQPVQSAAALLAAELRGDRPHPDRRQRQRAQLRPDRDPQGRDPARQAGVRRRAAGRRPHHHRHADALPPVRPDRRAQGRHGHAQQGRRLGRPI